MTTASIAVAPLPARPGSRGTIAALALGAAVAGAQSAVDQIEPGAAALPAEVVSAALVSVTAPVLPTAEPVLQDAPTTAEPDELASLVKGVDLGRRAAERVRAAEQNKVGPGGAVQPVVGRVTSSAGPRDGTTHYGLDIANRIGTPIVAVSDGVVERSGPASGFGLWVVLRHPDGSRSVYGHINRAFVRAGQRVTAGDRIAEVGNRGQSTGPHLHLEIWDRSGTKIDPEAWLRTRGAAIAR